jgi:hypothetical protein
MVQNYTRNHHYRNQATYYEGLCTFLKKDCIVHLEDKEDEYFWSLIFNKVIPEKKIKFLYSSVNEKGNPTTGVGHCLLYRPYLSRIFFICIDSDYRYLTQEVGINIQHFVFQTYTYSFENHFCYPDGLNDVCLNSCNYPNTIFDFQKFSTDYSSIIYELFVCHLYFVKHDISQFDKPEFFKIINFCQSNIEYTNAEKILDELQHRVANKLPVRKLISDIDFNALKRELMQLGLNGNNAFLYVRGHDYFDMICRIGNHVCEKILTHEKSKFNGKSKKIACIYKSRKPFKSQIFNNLTFERCPEFDKIKKDVLTLFA